MNESIILKCGFEVANCDHKLYLERLRKYSNETKIISIEEKYYHREIEEYSFEFDNYITKTIKIFKAKLKFGKTEFLALIEDEVIKIKNADELVKLTSANDIESLGFVYIIKSKLGYKIGYSKEIHKRNKIFNVKLPFQWEFAKIFCLKDYKLFEKFLHGAYSLKKINGEWFDLNENDLVTIERFYNEIKHPK
jgi:hypothetical protein